MIFAMMRTRRLRGAVINDHVSNFDIGPGVTVMRLPSALSVPRATTSGVSAAPMFMRAR